MIYKGTGLGLMANIVIGIVGSFVGCWLLALLNINLGSLDRSHPHKGYRRDSYLVPVQFDIQETIGIS